MGKGLEPVVQALAHFAGGFFGEGDGQDLMRQDLLPGRGRGPSSRARTMRETSIQVLPAPAQASTATLRRGSQAIA
jgi:hypothetical protein